MKTNLSFALVAMAVLTMAQFEGLPTCATSCAEKYLNAGIGNCGRDVKCICSNESFISGISCCLVSVCDTADQSSAITFAQQLCTAAGASVPGAAVCTSTSSAADSSKTADATKTGTDTTTTTTQATAAASTATGSGSGTVNQTSTPTTGATTAKATGSGSGSAAAAASSSASSSSTSNPAPRPTAGPIFGALGGIVAAVAML